MLQLHRSRLNSRLELSLCVISRKKLDPLEVYVPAVILTEFQIKDLGNVLIPFSDELFLLFA